MTLAHPFRDHRATPSRHRGPWRGRARRATRGPCPVHHTRRARTGTRIRATQSGGRRFRQVSTSPYTFVLADAAYHIEVNSTSPFTFIIPKDVYPIGTVLEIGTASSPVTTITAAAGVTLNGTPGLKLRTLWSVAKIYQRFANQWVAYGDLAA